MVISKGIDVPNTDRFESLDTSLQNILAPQASTNHFTLNQTLLNKEVLKSRPSERITSTSIIGAVTIKGEVLHD